MSSRENAIAMGSSSEVREESANQGTAARVVQPQAIAGRTVGVAEEIASPALHVSVDVTAKQPSADYADGQRVVEHGRSEPQEWLNWGCSDKKEEVSASFTAVQRGCNAGRKRQQAVLLERESEGGEGPLITAVWRGAPHGKGVFGRRRPVRTTCSKRPLASELS
ncbi:hypothetical protein HPB48_014166 [Haemaphysalis longicornis]|uniref:Uncharacterized protein n=1 Tax=Haemaphysalis longicornis TaxID=44386 RepID=A0A9J6FM14_HAELO|nr:hypothetical protein HPB48_014166 [Haemaphysalis longicornis]